MATKAEAERPIIFVGEGVRAILARLKTQTRRVIKPQPERAACGSTPWSWQKSKYGSLHTATEAELRERLCNYSFCPYGKPGDTLWVRETWWHEVGLDYENAAFADGTIVRKSPRNIWRIRNWWPEAVDGIWRKRSSIHMFRWACRLRLTLIDVRVQRLQDISPEDAIAEGIIVFPHGPLAPLYDYPGHDERANIGYDCPVKAYAAWWDVLNAKRGYPWSANNWVWPLTFEVQNEAN